VSDQPVTPEELAERLAMLRAAFAERTDREIRVVGVTKRHPVSLVAVAQAAGLVDLAENYAQELRVKATELGSAAAGTGTIHWHFIGQLQSNKVRLIAGDVSCWQSVDRIGVAEQIARRQPGARVMVQLDLAGIAGRGGCPPAEASALVDGCRSLELDVVGLMGVGAPGSAEEARPGFRTLVSLADELGLPERSIGMSDDALTAVEEGSTMVRLGSALFGPRPPA